MFLKRLEVLILLSRFNLNSFILPKLVMLITIHCGMRKILIKMKISKNKSITRVLVIYSYIWFPIHTLLSSKFYVGPTNLRVGLDSSIVLTWNLSNNKYDDNTVTKSVFLIFLLSIVYKLLTV